MATFDEVAYPGGKTPSDEAISLLSSFVFDTVKEHLSRSNNQDPTATESRIMADAIYRELIRQHPEQFAALQKMNPRMDLVILRMVSA